MRRDGPRGCWQGNLYKAIALSCTAAATTLSILAVYTARMDSQVVAAFFSQTACSLKCLASNPFQVHTLQPRLANAGPKYARCRASLLLLGAMVYIV
jgi:hypothetical protein